MKRGVVLHLNLRGGRLSTSTTEHTTVTSGHLHCDALNVTTPLFPQRRRRNSHPYERVSGLGGELLGWWDAVGTGPLRCDSSSV